MKHDKKINRNNMLYKNRLILTCIGVLSLIASTANSADIFSDSFESADMSATNTNGFKWANNNRTSIVIQSPTDGPVKVYENTAQYVIHSSTMPDDSPRNWSAFHGSHSLRFRYPAGEPWAEQRFDLGTPMKDIWIRYWLRVPANFAFGPTGSPNKFFSLWSDGYSAKGDGSTVWLSMHRVFIAGQPTPNASVGITYSNGGYTTSNGFMQDVPFITTSDRGRWMHVVMHFKAESSPGASDGVMQTYRRWQGDSTYTKLHEKFDLPIKTPTNGNPNGFKAGYLLGWANAAYTADTEWLLDDFVVSDSSPMGQLTGKMPKPPTNMVVQ